MASKNDREFRFTGTDITGNPVVVGWTRCTDANTTIVVIDGVPRGKFNVGNVNIAVGDLEYRIAADANGGVPGVSKFNEDAFTAKPETPVGLDPNLYYGTDADGATGWFAFPEISEAVVLSMVDNVTKDFYFQPLGARNDHEISFVGGTSDGGMAVLNWTRLTDANSETVNINGETFIRFQVGDLNIPVGSLEYRLVGTTEIYFNREAFTIIGVSNPNTTEFTPISANQFAPPNHPAANTLMEALAYLYSKVGSGTGETEPEEPAPNTLAVPTNFTANPVSDNRIDLSWAAVPNATSYTLQRATDSGFTANLVTIYTGDLLTIQNTTGLTPNTNYFYRVKATAANYPDSDYATTAAATLATPNIPPVASAGADNTITLPTNSVTLQGSGADSDGVIVSYLWEQVIGPNTASISNPAIANPLVSDLVEGTYEFRLIVTDDDGATHQDSLLVTVQPDPVKYVNVMRFPTGNTPIRENTMPTSKTGDFTVEVWRKITPAEIKNTNLFTFGSGATSGNISALAPYGAVAGSATANVIFDAGDFNTARVTAIGGHPTNVWVHFAFVSTNAGFRGIYKNSVLIASRTNATGVVNDLVGLVIGPTTGSGLIADLRIWDVARTPAQIQANMNYRLQPQDNLKLYWKLDGDAQDYSGNNYHGIPGTTTGTIPTYELVSDLTLTEAPATPTPQNVVIPVTNTNKFYNAYTSGPPSALAETKVQTNASSVEITFDAGIYASGYPEANRIAVWDGATYVGDVVATTSAINTKTIALPGTGSRTIRFVDGAALRPNDQGTVLTNAVTSLSFPAGSAATLVTPTKAAYGVFVIPDSIGAGFGTTSAARHAWPSRLRETESYDFIIDGWGVRSFARSLNTDALAQAQAQRAFEALNGRTKKQMYIAIGTNDFGASYASPTDAANYAALLIDKVHALDATIQIIFQGPLFRTNYATVNSFGGNLQTYIDAYVALGNTRPWLHAFDAFSWLQAEDVPDQGLHPDNAGNLKLAGLIKQKLASL